MFGIIAALECEVDAILTHMNETIEKEMHSIKVYEGMIHNQRCVVALAGVGKVKASKATTLVLSQYQCNAIINVGVAGGLRMEQEPLDVVIANHVIQHDFDTSAIDGVEGLGILATTDYKLNELCMNACQTLGLTYHIGDIASGDQFVTKHQGLDRIEKLFPTCVCAEMEAGAIANVANDFNIPCLIIRALSDIAPKENSNLDFSVFAAKASVNAGLMMNEVLKNYN